MPRKPRELERLLLKDGWIIKNQEGAHRQYVHPTKPGKITIPFHNKEVNKYIERSVLKQAGIKA